MIQLDEGAGRFQYRIAGVAIHDGQILLHHAGDEPFWALPGGRAEVGESAEDTLRREIREELFVDAEVGRLLWLVENFFDFDGLRYHELGLYFLMQLPPDSSLLTQTMFESRDGDTRLQFRWFPLDEETLLNLPLLPSFLPSGLTRLPTSLAHVVHRDRC